MNKTIHGLIVVWFAIACWFLWGMLTLTLHTTQQFLPGAHVPAFTSLCLSLRPVLVCLPILAVAYCLYVYFRPAQARNAWIGFFAGVTGVLVLVMLPTLIAAWLPVIAIIEKVGKS